MAQYLRWNCHKVLIIIVSIIINLALDVNGSDSFTDARNIDVNISQSDLLQLAERFSANYRELNEAPLAVEPVNEDNDTDKTEKEKLLVLYESTKAKYLSTMNDDRTQILNQIESIDKLLDSVSSDFNSVASAVSGNSDGSQSSRPQCTVTKEKLENIQKEIQAIISSTSDTSEGKSKCKLNFDATDNCNSLIKTIQCGLDHVKHGFNDNKGGSVEEVAKWRNAFYEITKTFEKEKDDLKQSLTQKHQHELDKLHTNMQELGKSLNDALEHLEKNTVELCVEEIVLGMIKEAVNHFNELKSTPISSIVGKAYDFDRHSSPDAIERTDNLAQFIIGTGREDRLDTFYEKMKARKHLNDFRVLIFSYTLSRTRALLTDEDAYGEIKYKEDKYISIFQDVFYFNQKNSEFNKFLQLYSGEYFRYYSIQIIWYSLTRLRDSPDTNSGKSATFINMLDCIKTFPYYNQIADTLNVVKGYIVDLKRFYRPEGHVVMRLIADIVYYKNKLLKTNNIKQTENVKNKFEDTLKTLPENVVKFIANPNACHIKGAISPGYMYADNSTADTYRRRISVWKLSVPQGVPALQSKWKFESFDNMTYYTIKNVYFNEYFYAADLVAEHGKSERTVFTWTPKQSAGEGEDWKVILDPSKSYQFNIINKFRKEYLCMSNALLGLAGRVHTWKDGIPTEKMMVNCMWSIEC